MATLQAEMTPQSAEQTDPTLTKMLIGQPGGSVSVKVEGSGPCGPEDASGSELTGEVIGSDGPSQVPDLTETDEESLGATAADEASVGSLEDDASVATTAEDGSRSTITIELVERRQTIVPAVWPTADQASENTTEGGDEAVAKEERAAAPGARTQYAMMRWAPNPFMLLSPRQVALPHGAASYSLLPLSLRRASNNNASGYVGSDIGATLRQQQNIPDAFAINDSGGTLAALFGSITARDDFFEHLFGRRTAYFPRSRRRIAPPIAGIDLIKGWSENAPDKSETSCELMTEYVAEGGSVVVPVTPYDHLHTTKLRIERALGTPTAINIHHSRPSLAAGGVDCDSWPVLVLQLAGETRWTIQNDGFRCRMQDVEQWENVTVAAGDLLYIPKGVYRMVTTARGCKASSHMTIQLTPAGANGFSSQ